MRVHGYWRIGRDQIFLAFRVAVRVQPIWLRSAKSACDPENNGPSPKSENIFRARALDPGFSAAFALAGASASWCQHRRARLRRAKGACLLHSAATDFDALRARATFGLPGEAMVRRWRVGQSEPSRSRCQFGSSTRQQHSRSTTHTCLTTEIGHRVDRLDQPERMSGCPRKQLWGSVSETLKQLRRSPRSPRGCVGNLWRAIVPQLSCKMILSALLGLFRTPSSQALLDLS